MKKREWNEGLNHLDLDIVEKYLEQKDVLGQKKHSRKGVWLRLGAIAACFLLIGSAVIAVSMLRESDQIIPPQPETTATDTTNAPGALTATYFFSSFEEFNLHEKQAGQNAVSYYYTPGYLTSDYELLRITKRDGTYIMIEYMLSPNKIVQTEGLDEYDAERMSTLICRYSLYADGEQALRENFISKGYAAVEYQGKVYYRLDEHAQNDPNKQKIGYEIAFLEDGDLIFMHLPAVDTFENMMKFAKLTKVKLD